MIEIFDENSYLGLKNDFNDPILKANLVLRSNITRFCNERNYQTWGNHSIIPGASYSRYPLTFMSAMTDRLEWIYQESIPEVVTTSVSTSFCIRGIASFTDAGLSNKHLKCFEMLTIAGKMNEEEILQNSIDLLRDLLPNALVELYIVLHPGDEIAKQIAYRNDLAVVEDESCVFEQPAKTDRSGSKVEIKARKQLDGRLLEWELLNVLALSHINQGQTTLDTPLSEASGSIERIVALNEEVSNVFLTSCFSIKDIQKILRDNGFNIRITEILGIQDLIRPLILMGLSGVSLGGAVDKKNNKEYIYYRAAKELAYRSALLGVPANVLISCFGADLKTLVDWIPIKQQVDNVLGKLSDDFHLVAGNQLKQYEATKRYVERFKGDFSENLRQRVAGLYNGGSTRLVDLVLHHLNMRNQGNIQND